MAKKELTDIKAKAVIHKTSKSLDELIIEYSKIAEVLEYGEVTEELEQQLGMNKEDVANKLVGYKYVIDRNSSMIEGVYKPESERISMRIKKLDRVNAYLKDKCVFAAQIFGTNNKYQSEFINVSAVATKSLHLDEQVVQEELASIRECIAIGNVQDITQNQEILKYSVTVAPANAQDASVLAKVLNKLNIGFELNINIDKTKAKNLIENVEEVNAALMEEYEESVKGLSDYDKELIPKPELAEFGFKGLSITQSHYPRFS